MIAKVWKGSSKKEFVGEIEVSSRTGTNGPTQRCSKQFGFGWHWMYTEIYFNNDVLAGVKNGCGLIKWRKWSQQGPYTEV